MNSLEKMNISKIRINYRLGTIEDLKAAGQFFLITLSSFNYPLKNRSDIVKEKELLHTFYIVTDTESHITKAKEAIINEKQARKRLKKLMQSLRTIYSDKLESLICDVIQFERIYVNTEGNITRFQLIVDIVKEWNNDYINPIREARLSVGLSQTTASELIGVPLRTWQSWELGTRHPAKYVEKLIIDKLTSTLYK